LYHPGKQAFQQVTIDDYIPVRKQEALYSGPTLDGEVWVPLIEKAFAKMCGSYKNLEHGSVAWGLLYLCGGEVAESWLQSRGRWSRRRTVWKGKSQQTVNRSRAEELEQEDADYDANEIWSLLRKYMERCFPTVCRIRAGADAVGLTADRYYSVLGAREVKVNSGSISRMVFLRNPFGIGEWEGRWSDEDIAWDHSPATKQQLHFSPEPDGCFWMHYNDFLQLVDEVAVATKAMPIQGCHRVKCVGLKRGLGLLND
jgi:hypothetical protein